MVDKLTVGLERIDHPSHTSEGYMRSVPFVLILCLSFALANAQQIPKYMTPVEDVTSPASVSILQAATQPVAVKRPGHYTTRNWAALIDSAWDAGPPTATKLGVFDAFWNTINTNWGGFPNLDINWDSLKSVYRPQVSAGLTRGRFAGILGRLTRALHEWHAYAYDPVIDASVGITSSRGQVLCRLSAQRITGLPVLDYDGIIDHYFGAGVTSLGDSVSMVYSAPPDHPLGLRPGDLILGYDGIRWKDLIRELWAAELPTLGGAGGGSNTQGIAHGIMRCVGANWSLFDTIDIVKYPSNDTINLPTSLLHALPADPFYASEQLPVPGVPLPSLASKDYVSWGVIQGTNIGYANAWDWEGDPEGKTKTQFGQAIYDLVVSKKVSGLVLDWRTNVGGWEDYANEGFKYLFDSDPTDNYARAIRTSANDHFGFSIMKPYAPDYFTPVHLFDHPIAVLTGPCCGSAGDYNAFRMRFHPMVRFFGKPTAGAYVDETTDPNFALSGYKYRVDNGSVYSNVNGEGIMIHKTFPVDEEVWLTREGVAKGEDDVVKRALQWMDSLSYAHDVLVSKDTVQNPADSIRITAQVTNPGQHTLVVSAIVTTAQGLVTDSVVLSKAPAGSLWHAFISAPHANGRYSISVRTNDVTAGTYRKLPNAASFTAIVTDVHQLAEDLPKDFGLQQNYPNPFNPTTLVRYQLPVVSDVRLGVYDLLGREVSVVVSERKAAGSYEVKFDGTNLSSGVYFYRIQAGEFCQTKRCVLVK
jgi:hypothetical protein